jgi:hypothetical protein
MQQLALVNILGCKMRLKLQKKKSEKKVMIYDFYFLL